MWKMFFDNKKIVINLHINLEGINYVICVK